MKIILNGNTTEVTGTNLSQLIEHLAMSDTIKNIAIEVDGAIVSRSKYDSFIISDGMKIELIHFVGGG